MRSGRRRPSLLVLGLSAACAVAAALLLYVAYFHSAPPQGHLFASSPSPDRTLLLRVYYIYSGGPLGDDSGRVEVVGADGQQPRTIYYGPAANASWDGDQRVVVVEQESQRGHVIDVSSGGWDARWGIAFNLVCGIVLIVLATLGAGTLVAFLPYLLGHGSRQSQALAQR